MAETYKEDETTLVPKIRVRRFPNDFISKDVMKQLKIRSRLMGRDASLKGGNAEEVNDLFLQNKLFNTGWVTLISSVDNLECSAVGGPYEKELLAKNFVLSGGSLIWDSEAKVLRKREGINFTDPLNKSAAYNLSVYSGFKPMPGITDFSIVSEGSSGLVRKATIKFTVWTLEELDLIERLYFRPGYHAILEWGHTNGVSNEVELINSLSLLTNNFEEYFTPGTRNDLYKKILEKQKKLDYNYDGVVGLITNFQFSFRKDLGYDCTIEIRTHSTLAESFTMRTGEPDVNKIVEDGQQSPDYRHKTEFISNLIEIYENIPVETKNSGAERTVTIDAIRASNYENLKRVEDLISRVHEKRSSASKVITLDYNDEDTDLTQESKVILDPNPNYYGIVKTINESSLPNNNSKTSNVIGYMPLKVLLYYINQFIEDNTEHDKVPTYDVNFDTEYTTFGNHTTINPVNAILPSRPNSPFTESLYPLIGNVQKVSPKYLNADRDREFRCLDIHVSTRLLEQVLETFKETSDESSKADMHRFMTSVLQNIDDALGKVNEFILYYDETTNRFHIVDQSAQPARVARQSARLTDGDSQFTVAGLRGLASELNISTVINKELGSALAAAAAHNDGSPNTNIGPFKEWNEFLIDRFSPPPPGSLTSISLQKNCSELSDYFSNKYKVNEPSVDSPCGESSTGVLPPSVKTFVNNTPWSAGFISSIMKDSSTPFPLSGAHTDYAQRLRNNPQAYPGWQILDPRTTKVQTGDIIIQNRAENNMTFSQNPWTGASHGDIVTSVVGDQAKAIGGNVSDKVVTSSFTLINGRLKSNNFFAILRPPPTAVPGIAGTVTQEFGKWSTNGWTENNPQAYDTLKKYYTAGNLQAPNFVPSLPCTEETTNINPGQTNTPPVKPSSTYIPGITPDFLAPKIPSSNNAPNQPKTGGYKPAELLPTPAFAWKNDTAFIEGVNKLAQKMDVDANDLLALFASESGVNPAAVNEKTNATGLIQFMPVVARELGTTVEALAKMTRTQQLEYVDKYFTKKWKVPKGASAGQLYAFVFLPGRANNEVLTDSSEKYYTWNPGLDLNNDGKITRTELDVRMERKKKEFGIAPKTTGPGTDTPPPSSEPPPPYKPGVTLGPQTEEEIQANRQRENAIKIDKFITVFERVMGLYRGGGYYSEEWRDIMNDGGTIFRDTIYMSNKAAGNPPAGLLPINISFTLDGIAGLKLAEVFTIQKGLLPDRYGAVAFLINGIDNTVAQNRWSTSIRAQSFRYIRPLEVERQEAEKLLIRGFYLSSSSTSELFTSTTGTDTV